MIRTARDEAAERRIYNTIAGGNGLKAREIAARCNTDRTAVNRYLYGSPYMRELCRKDGDGRWHALIRQARPHTGIGDFSGWAGTVREFLCLKEAEWFDALCLGCARIGRSLNDTRGLFHSFRDCRQTLTGLFEALDDLEYYGYGDWETVFEFRINRARMIRIYADVLLITEDRVFSLEFKMKDRVIAGELSQAVKYAPYLEVLFGPEYDVIPALVLTGTSDLYRHECLGDGDAAVPVCSGDMLFNLLDEYIGIIPET